LEVSVFGPGFGECIILHLGDSNWAVIDSCLDPASKQPAALLYLDCMGIDAAKSVQLVVATHWHDDHIQGISKVFQTAIGAVFACTGAVQEPDFLEVLAAWTGTRFLSGGSGIDELQSAMVELKRRSGDSRCPAPKLASVGKSFWPVRGKPNPLAMSIMSMSPSDAAVLATISRLRGVVPKSKTVRRRLPNLQENDTSVVLSVEAAGHRVLLGGDLHVRADRSFGWLAIVDEEAGARAQHHVFKVPHHGSPTGHSDEVWDELLVQHPFAVTTPFVDGKVRLPSLGDCRRIVAKTPSAFLSAPPIPSKFRDANRTIEKTVLEATRSVQFVPGKYGHVRLRKRVDESPSGSWRVELFGSAVSMADYVRTAG
jgi:hypothetical protein